MHEQLSDLVDQLNQMKTNLPSGQIAKRLSEVFKLQHNTLHQPTNSNTGLDWPLDINLGIEGTLNASKSTKITLGTSDSPIKEP